MTRKWTRRGFLAAGGVALTVGSSGCLTTPAEESESNPTLDQKLSVDGVELFSSPGCSCCGSYASYLSDNVEGTVTKTVTEDSTALKQEFGVPSELRSCHTVAFDDYIVEGHVPVDAIAELLAGTPSIDGIALPSMPAGSPGMGGDKDGPFRIRTFTDGEPGDVFAEY